MTNDLTSERSLDDEELVKIVAKNSINGFVTRDFHRPHEKAALTKARSALKTIKHYLQRSE